MKKCTGSEPKKDFPEVESGDTVRITYVVGDIQDYLVCRIKVSSSYPTLVNLETGHIHCSTSMYGPTITPDMVEKVNLCYKEIK